jgi:hypothetical protein
MIVIQKNPNIDRIIDFVCKFSSSLTTSSRNLLSDTLTDAGAAAKASSAGSQATTNGTQSQPQQMDTTGPAGAEEATLQEEEEDDTFENPLFLELLHFLMENSKASHDAVRYRCCNILGKLMGATNSEQFIDEDLYNGLCDVLLERLKDVNSRVQVQAITAIYRLQDPNDRECRVIKALQYLLSYDPNWQVRYQALSQIAFSKQTLPDIIDRVRDPNPNCRKKALLILSEKVLIKFISIEKRLFILRHSLKDSDESVLDVCVKKLLPSWLNFKENDLCKLLKALDVVDSTDICQLMLNKMYEDTSLDRLCGEFGHHLNER